MIEAKLQKKYDYLEYNSELIIPKENYADPTDDKTPSQNANLILKEQIEPNSSYNNNLIIENSTFIIKAPNKKKILLILSIDKDLPAKIEKNIYSIPLDFPVLQAISFMHDSKNESIIITTGSEDSIDKIQVFQIQLKQLMHEALYNLLKDIKNAVKIFPIKDSFALVLHYSTEKYKNGGLKLWKDFKEEIYNFNKIYNFTYNYKYNKVICLDNKEAPFIISIYNFDESYFNKKPNEILQPDFFIQVGDHLNMIKEEDIESFLQFESFCNLIIFWSKLKKEKIGFSFGIFFINFKEKKCVDYVEFNFDGNNNYIFKINKYSNEIYIFNLSEELLFIYCFKAINETQNEELSSKNLFLSKIKFSGNISGIDFTANNGMVVLTKQYNLVCYSRNEHIFKERQKKYSEEYSQNDSNLENNSEKEEKLKTYEYKIKNMIPDIFNQDNDLKLKKYNSEKIVKHKNSKRKEINYNFDNKNKKLEQKNKKNINNKDNEENEEDKNEMQLKIKEDFEKRQELLIKQKDLLEKLKVKNKEKNLIKKLAFSFENKLSKFEENLFSGISLLKLEEILNQIQFDNSRNRNIKLDYFDFTLIKAYNYIYEIQSLMPDLKYIKNKIIYFMQGEINRKKIEKEKDEYNCDYEALKFQIKSIDKELKEKPNLKNEIEKIIYNCSSIENKINFLAKINGIMNIFEKKMNLLLLKCKNEINQINEMYKYNKYKMSKNEETVLINALIKPFIEFLSKEIKELEEKMNILIKKEKVGDEYDNIIIDNDEKKDYNNQLSSDLQDIFEKNNFYSLNENIIKNHYINLDDEF